MNKQELIDSAVEKAGGVRSLARNMDWHASAIVDARNGKRPLPAHRAAELAEVIGEAPEKAYIEALREQAHTDLERRILGKLLRASKAACVYLTIGAALAAATLHSAKADAAGVSDDRRGIYIMHIYTCGAAC